MKHLVRVGIAVLVVFVAVASVVAADRGSIRGAVASVIPWQTEDGKAMFTVTLKGEGPWQAMLSVGPENKDAYALVSALKPGDRVVIGWTAEGGRAWIREIGREGAVRPEGERREGERREGEKVVPREGERREGEVRVEGERKEGEKVERREGGDREVEERARAEARERAVKESLREKERKAREGGVEGERKEGERRVEGERKEPERRVEGERRDGEVRKEGARDGEVRKEGPRDGEVRKEGPRDGEVRKEGARDGERKEGERRVEGERREGDAARVRTAARVVGVEAEAGADVRVLKLQAVESGEETSFTVSRDRGALYELIGKLQPGDKVRVAWKTEAGKPYLIEVDKAGERD